MDYKLDSRDIEDMDSLIVRMPKVAAMMNIGLAGMFLAPFGMVISKAVTLKALVDVHPLLASLLAFGGGATMFFYAKWMGKTLMVQAGSSKPGGVDQRMGVGDHDGPRLPHHSGLYLLPLISSGLVDPYIRIGLRRTAPPSKGRPSSSSS